jgi:hypothetical protein
LLKPTAVSRAHCCNMQERNSVICEDVNVYMPGVQPRRPGESQVSHSSWATLVPSSGPLKIPKIDSRTIDHITTRWSASGVKKSVPYQAGLSYYKKLIIVRILTVCTFLTRLGLKSCLAGDGCFNMFVSRHRRRRREANLLLLFPFVVFTL